MTTDTHDTADETAGDSADLTADTTVAQAGTAAAGPAAAEAPTADTSFFGLDDEVAEPTGPDLRTYDRHVVTAVLVSHDGGRWLPWTLAALERLARAPQRVVAVDTGSTDATRALLVEALGESAVLSQPEGTGFGAAAAGAVDALKGAPGLPAPADDPRPVVEWVWLLHDDSAPEPETLRRLLAVADASPSIGVLGPKVRGWHDSSRLLEVGVSIDGGGRRETGLDRGELDQGQHDGRGDVLAVGSAGLLVRRDVWVALGGLDPDLPLFRDDVDLGWRANLAGHRVVVVTGAVMHHVEAGSHGRRPLPAVRGSVHRADRAAAVHVLLANCSLVSLPWHWLRLFVGTLLRTLGLLLGKAPLEAWDELAGAGSVLLNPARVARARRRRRATRALPHRAVHHLLPPWTSGFRHGLDAIGGLVSGRTDLSQTAGSGLESGPTSDDAEDLVVGPSRVRSLASRPGVRLGLLLVLGALVAWRGLLVGDGFLQGGALLPPPSGAGPLWDQYAAGWHDVGVGSPIAAPPYLVALAVLSTALLGKVWLAVSLLLLLAVPLAGIVAYVLAGRLTRRTWLRVAAAVAYALLPAVTGAVAGGRLGTAVAAWLLPPALWLAGRGVGVGGAGGSGSWRRIWVGAVLLTVVVAFAPTVWPALVVTGVLTVLVWAPGSPGAWLRMVACLAVSPLLLMPWTQHLLTDRAALLLEAGAPARGLADPTLPAWQVAVANPGGPGVPYAWITVPLVLAGLAALLRGDRRRAVLTAWAVTAGGLAVGLLTAGRTVTPDSLGTPVAVWPGTATLLVGGGLVAAALLGADELRTRLRGHRFGWRQPVALALVGVTALVPFVLAGSWLARGASDVLVRSGTDVLPAYVQAASEVPTRPRALVLQMHADGLAAYALVAGDGRTIGDAEVAPPASDTAGLSGALSALVSGTGGFDDVQAVASYGVGFVVVDAPVPVDLQRGLDGTPGLTRVSSGGEGAVWRLDNPGARVTLLRPPARPVPVPADPGQTTTTVDAYVPVASAAIGPGLLRVAEAADPGWVATADDQRLEPRTLDGWAQGFTVPAGATHLTLRHDSDRGRWMVVEGVLLGVVVLLALPSRRRRTDDEGDDVDRPDAPLVAELAPAPTEQVTR